MKKLLLLSLVVALSGCKFTKNENDYKCSEQQIQEMLPHYNLCRMGEFASDCYEKLVPLYCTDATKYEIIIK